MRALPKIATAYCAPAQAGALAASTSAGSNLQRSGLRRSTVTVVARYDSLNFAATHPFSSA